MDQNPVEALTKPRRPLRVAGIVGALALTVTGLGFGTYALAQTAAPEPEPTYIAQPKSLANQLPTAAFTSGVSDLTVNLDGSTSADVDGELVDYQWDFGDGNTGTGATTSHAYAGYGVYTVTLTVTDDRGDTHTATGAVELIAPPPPPPPPTAPACPSGATPNEVSNGVIVSCIYGPEYCSEYSPDHPDWHCRGPFAP